MENSTSEAAMYVADTALNEILQDSESAWIGFMVGTILLHETSRTSAGPIMPALVREVSTCQADPEKTKRLSGSAVGCLLKGGREERDETRAMSRREQLDAGGKP